MALKAPTNWEFLELMMPTERTEGASRPQPVRTQLFAEMDANGNERLGVDEVRPVINEMVRIPGIQDYLPAIQCAMKATRENIRMFGDYGKQWLMLNSFRVFLFYQKRYIKLLVSFFTINTDGDNRIDEVEFVKGAPFLKQLGVKAVNKKTFDDIEKGNPKYVRFDEFAEWILQQGSPQQFVVYEDEMADPSTMNSGPQKATGKVMKSQVYLDFRTIRDKLPLQRDEAGLQVRLAFWHILSVSDGFLSPSDVSSKLSTLFAIPGVNSFDLPVRMAFESAMDSLELEGGEKRDDIGWESFYALVYHLRLYVELWARFCVADSSGDRKIDCEEFAAVAGLLQDWGLQHSILRRLMQDSDAVFKEVDHDGSGYIRFLEFVDWAMQNLAYEFPSLMPDPQPTKEMLASVSGSISNLVSLAPLIDWQVLAKEFPSDFSAESFAARKESFTAIDNDHTGGLVVFEVNAALKSTLHLRVRDYTPPVRLAFADTLTALPPIGDATQDFSEEIGWRQYRVFNIFLVRYLELWLTFLAARGATSSEHRLGYEDFATMLPQLSNWGLHVEKQKLTDPTFTAASFAKFASQDKNSDGGMTFKQFVSWCMTHSPQPELNLSKQEMTPAKGGYEFEVDVAADAANKARGTAAEAVEKKKTVVVEESGTVKAPDAATVPAKEPANAKAATVPAKEPANAKAATAPAKEPANAKEEVKKEPADQKVPAKASTVQQGDNQGPKSDKRSVKK